MDTIKGRKTKVREARRSGARLVESLFREGRYSLRRLLKSPIMTLGVVLTLALGIGANSAIFTLLDAVAFRSLPIPRAQDLHAFGAGSIMGSIISDGPEDRRDDLFSVPMYRALEARNDVFSGLAAVGSYPINAFLAPDPRAHPERARARLVSGSFFAMLGLTAPLGRLIEPSDDLNPGGHAQAVVSHGLWIRRFGGDPGLVGSEIYLNGLKYTVIGVAPPGFTGITSGVDIGVWVPLAMQAELEKGSATLDNKDCMWLRLVGRLEPGVTAVGATAQINGLYQQLVREEFGEALTDDQQAVLETLGTEIVPVAAGFSVLRGRYKQPLYVLMGVVGMVLLVACINIGTLLLARAQRAQRDVALHMALGSSRRRVLLALLLESCILAAMGGVLALLVARWTVGALLGLVSGRTPLVLDTALDYRVLIFTFGVSLLTALLFGLAPALKATGTSLTALLRSRTVAGDGPRRGWSLRQILVTSQVAVSLLLLVCAGLFSRSLNNLVSQDLGFQTQGVLTVTLDPQGGGFTLEQLPALYRDLEARVEALAQAPAASLSLFELMGRARWVTQVAVDGYEPGEEGELGVELNAVTPGYFDTVGTQVVEGRAFSVEDRGDSPQVAVVTQAFARHFFGEESALGKRFGMEGPESDRDIEIVGVVPDMKYRSLREDPPRLVFFPAAQHSDEYLGALHVRTLVEPAALAAQVRHAVEEAAPGLPILSIHPLTDDLDRSLRQERLLSRLTSLFGLLALLLASIGLFGVLLYSVSKRTNEIGIRMALGAHRSRVLAMVLHHALVSVGVGVVLGIVGALALGQLLSSLLFGVAPSDPRTIAVAVTTLFFVAAVAALWPAWRAARLDPAKALRAE